MTERHSNVSPILIDLDFRFNFDIKDRQYDDNLIINFLKLYVSELISLVNVDQSKIVAYILEKTSPVSDEVKNYTKDGIHIVFPYIVTSPNIQYVLRYKMISSKKCKQLFQDMNVSNTLDDIFDIAVIERNNWQMYGSTKPGCEPYKLTKISSLLEISNEFKNLDISNYTEDTFKLIKTLSIQDYNENDTVSLICEKVQEFDKFFEKLPAKHKKRKNRSDKSKRKKKSPKSKQGMVDQHTLNLCQQLIDILSIPRADNHDNWMRVGWCLHNIDDRLLDDWVKFSSKSEKSKTPGVDHGRSKERCIHLWDQMDDDGLKEGSLHLWAKEDNPKKYQSITSNNLRGYLLRSLNCTHYDIAQVVHAKFKHEFHCSSSKKKVWYQFKNHRWHLLDDNVELKTKISNDIVNEYLSFSAETAKKAAEMEADDPNKDTEMEKVKKIATIALKLKVTNFKKNVLDECTELFYRDKFEEELDNRIDLIGFENGVYDLEKEEFRDGLPEDFISNTTGICYEEYNDSDEDLLDVKNFLEQVLPKKEEREYVITLLSSFITGKTGEEKFHIWTGSGGNGKSKLIELFELSFGDYCCTLPITVLTRGRSNADVANPALARTKGKRFACLQEPEHNEQIHVGLMKELTGGDKIHARGLYKEPIEFKPQFKLVLTCNELPGIPANDRGTWRRIRVVEFISKFTDDPDPNEPYEFPIDHELSEKLREWPEAFMYMLIERYKKYKRNGLKEPPSVKKNTEDYQADSDIFKQFMNEKIIELDADVMPPGSNSGLKLDDAYFAFLEWYKQAWGGGSKTPNRKELRKEMEKNYGKPNPGNIWNGIVFRNEDTHDILDF